MINYSGLKRIAFPTQAPDPYTPFIQAVQGLAGRAPQQSADMQRQEANKYRRAALNRMVQGAGMQAPQMEQGMDGKQALGVLLASLFGRALGANPGDVNDFVAGFTQARQNQASQANEQKMREFEMQQRQNQVLSQADLGYADIANDEANRLQGYIDRDRADTDARMRAQQEEDNWYKRQDYTYANKVDLKERDALIKGMMSQNPEIAADAARRYYIGDPAAVAAYSSLSPAQKLIVDRAAAVRGKEQRDTEMHPLKMQEQEYKNIIKQAEAEVAPQYFQNRVKLQDWQMEKIATWVQNYPAYLQLALAKYEVSAALASNSIANSEFDNKLNVWKSTTATEIEGHIKRTEKIEDEMEKVKTELQAATDDKVRETLTMKLNGLAFTRDKIRKRIEALAGTVPKPVPVDPQGMFGGQQLNSGLPPVGGPTTPVPQNTPKPTAPTSPKPQPSPSPKNPKPQPKASGGKPRTVNVGGTTVKVYPKKG